jgi:hypothetical protein
VKINFLDGGWYCARRKVEGCKHTIYTTVKIINATKSTKPNVSAECKVRFTYRL